MAKYDVASYNLIYIYAINDETHKGLLKIGQTSFSSKYSIAQLPPNCSALNQNAHARIQQQTKTALVSYDLLYTELATRTITMADGSKQIQSFQDHDVHDVILQSGYSAVKFVESGKQSEWFKIDLTSAKAAILAVKEGKSVLPDAKTSVVVAQKQKITLRDEQKENVEKTIDIFKRYDTMLWNCKMRYGKTVTAYELIKRQHYQKVIVITHRPAVEDGWGTDHDLMFAGEKHLFIDKTNGSVDYDSKKAENVRAILEIIEREHGYTGEFSPENFSIEHVYNDSDSENNSEIGNLILLETKLNEACKSKDIADKIDIYQKSNLYLPKEIDSSTFNMSERTERIIQSIYDIIKELKE